MSAYDLIALIGGLALFLFGMNVMGNALEKRAGSSLKNILGRLTSNKFKGFLLGLGITAVIQSSSATTVMVVGFVNSGLMKLSQAIGVIMGANLGTSVTSWILSLTGVQGDSFVVNLFKPTTFTPIIAFIGILIYMFSKNTKKKDTATVLLGFAVLMFGMEAMSDAVKPLAESEAFQKSLTLFSNPILGVVMGMVVTAVVQSSSASVGILQALSMTGSVTYMTAIPIIMGQNIGTCVSALISSMGATKNAKRAAFVHLYFNVIATVILLPVFYLVEHFADIPIIQTAANPLGIAVVHTVFKLLALAILMPLTNLLEKLACLTVKDNGKNEGVSHLLDERLLNTPAVAVEQSRTVSLSMAQVTLHTLKNAFDMLEHFDGKIAETVREGEAEADMYEDTIGGYLVKLSMRSLTDEDSREVSKQLHVIGDLERISDHALNILEAAEELKDKKMTFSGEAKNEMRTMINATIEVADLAISSLTENNVEKAALVEPLEQVIDDLKTTLKNNHIERLRKKGCTIEQGFVFNDLVTNIERISDHCSNIAVCVIETAHDRFDMHEYLNSIKNGSEVFNRNYESFREKYAINE
ncbi:MAG TPA: Na/Pi cotransporter [Ruminococcaceae bacterium]|nr:Na/Pi cotransporter [Oscillospiraceae bacterium]